MLQNSFGDSFPQRSAALEILAAALRCLEKLAANNSLMAQLVDIGDEQGRTIDLVGAVHAVRTSSVAAEQQGTLQQMDTLEQLIASQLESAKKKQESTPSSPSDSEEQPAAVREGAAGEDQGAEDGEEGGSIEQWSWRRSPSRHGR